MAHDTNAANDSIVASDAYLCRQQKTGLVIVIQQITATWLQILTVQTRTTWLVRLMLLSTEI